MSQAQEDSTAGIANSCARFFDTCVANANITGSSSTKSFVGFLASWAAFLLILFAMPLPEGLTPAGKATMAVVAWACITWISEAMPVGITGIAIPMLLVLSRAVEKFPQSVGGFTSNAYFICMIAFILAAIIQVAGIDRRIAVSMLHKMRIKTANSTIWGLFGVNFILSIIVPGANPRGALLLPIITGITKLFGDTRERPHPQRCPGHRGQGPEGQGQRQGEERSQVIKAVT